MRIQLSDHFTYRRILRFVLPSIVMMVFSSIYGVIDGLCVSNFAGKTQFAAINLIMPFPMMLGTLGYMIGTGGSALVGKELGEGKKDLANEHFSMLVYVSIAIGVFISIVGIFMVETVARAMGAEGDILQYSVLYGRIIMISMAPFMLLSVFQSFMVTAEKPGLGLVFTVFAGCTNIVLDIVLVGLLKWGVAGAAVATAVSQAVGGLSAFVYFMRPNTSLLKLVKTKFDGPALGKTCFNGASELMTNVSTSLVNMLYNVQLMRLAGENGVAAYGVIMYVNFIFVGTFFGYAVGTAPVISYNYGSGNHKELHNLYSKSLKIIGVFGIVMMGFALLASGLLAGIFVGYDPELFEMTKRGFSIYSLSFLVMGCNVFASSFFTALGNGLVSAIISFMRALVFQVAAVLILPAIFQLDGVWMSVVAAETLALFISIFFMKKEQKKYHYGKAL